MSAADRYAGSREPRPIATLSRPQLVARIVTLRDAVDACWLQSDTDGGEPFACVGAMKAALITLTNDLRECDRKAGLPFAAAVTVPAAESRLRRAHGELQSVRAELEADRVRAPHRAQGPAETHGHQERALAPARARELQADGRGA